ncbi:MAG TPA: Rdx family protein [Trueperaceae bacterium]|nr:Rdx family protein [Trueperaceae bacterium]
MSAPTVEIEYCVPCNYLPRAIDAQKAILERFGQRIDGVKLKTGASGVFTIRVDGEQVYSKPEEFNIDAVIDGIAGRV